MQCLLLYICRPQHVFLMPIKCKKRRRGKRNGYEKDCLVPSGRIFITASVLQRKLSHLYVLLGLHLPKKWWPSSKTDRDTNGLFFNGIPTKALSFLLLIWYIFCSFVVTFTTYAKICLNYGSEWRKQEKKEGKNQFLTWLRETREASNTKDNAWNRNS